MYSRIMFGMIDELVNNTEKISSWKKNCYKYYERYYNKDNGCKGAGKSRVGGTNVYRQR